MEFSRLSLCVEPGLEPHLRPFGPFLFFFWKPDAFGTATGHEQDMGGQFSHL